MTAKDRITEFRKSHLDIGINAFEEMCGFSSNSLKAKNPGWDKLEAIGHRFPELNMNWVISGKGNMFLSEEKEESGSVKIGQVEPKDGSSAITPERHLIPFYDIRSIAGRYSGADMEPVAVATEMIDAGDWFHDATAAMRIYGDSMTPDYKSGSIVALKEVHDKRIILYGDDYVIETNEIRVLKRLQRANERSCWLACSTNLDIWEDGPQKGRLIHEPFEIPIDMVRRLYLVVGEVNRKHGDIINFNER